MTGVRISLVLASIVWAASAGRASAGTYEAPLDTRKAAEAKFAAEPRAVKAGGKVKISFAAGAATDVEVAVLDAKGQVVRHLAAGLLGKNAPPPLAKDSLAQELEWDLRADNGQPAAGGPFKVRVRLGLGAEMDRFIPAERPPVPSPTALGVGPDGTLYVLASEGKKGGAYLYVLDREGKYLRTLLPPPAGLKKEQVRDLGRLKLADGSEVPVIYNAYMADTAPYLAGFRSQRLEVTAEGTVVMASGGSDWSDQAVPRHVLAINSDGTVPETGFVGPELGAKRRYASGLRPQQLALSPDGKTIYFAGMGSASKKKGISGGHTIARLTWDSKAPEPFVGKPDEAGADGEHLNDPRSVSTDAKGNIYVSDFGNGRVAVFDPEGKYLGETKVPNPGFACVHPATGALYVGGSAQPLTGKHEPAKPYFIVKFDKGVGGKEVARYEFGNYRYAPVFALDAGAEPPKLWLSYAPAWGRSALVPLADQGEKLVPGENSLGGAGGFASPLFLSADPKHDRLYVGDHSRKVLKVDLAGGDQISPFLTASEAAVDGEGNVYALMGYNTNSLERFGADGKKLPFPGSGSNRIEVIYRAGLPHVGVRGLTVAPSGDIYVYEEKGKPEQLHVFGPDGVEKKKSVIADMPVDSANGIAVDRAGNIYSGICVHDPKNMYPDELEGQIPPLAWYMLYTEKSGWYSWPQRKIPEAPWKHGYINFYLYHYGSVFKFTPAGGRFWIGEKPLADGANPRPEGVPADAVEYREGYLKRVVWCSGAEWRYRGFGINVNRTESWGDPACSCYTSRFCLDEPDRLFVPDIFRFKVLVLDTAGNEIARIGRYGNWDSPAESLPLASPNAVAVMKDKVYVVDRKSRRIVVVRLTFAAEASCQVP